MSSSTALIELPKLTCLISRSGRYQTHHAGVSFEDRKLLLGHKAQHVTTHYSAPEIGALIEASAKVCELESRASPAISVARSHA
jgi:hypothetical protein